MPAALEQAFSSFFIAPHLQISAIQCDLSQYHVLAIDNMCHQYEQCNTTLLLLLE